MKTGAVRPDLPSVGRPSIQWEMRVVMLQNLRNSAAQHNISAAMLQNMTTTRKLISELEHRMAEPTAKGLASAVSDLKLVDPDLLHDVAASFFG